MQGWRRLLGALLGLLALSASADDGWMRADWAPTLPHLADAGLEPRTLGNLVGNRLFLFRQAPRETVLPGPQGPRRFADTRYVTAVARVDIPAEQARAVLQDFAGYRNLFPLMKKAEVQAVDGANVLSADRLSMPLPVASFQVGLRLKNRLESDGSIVSMLVDGQAESTLAMLGGFTDTLRSQPAAARWEVFPLDARHALIALSVWSGVELQSGLAQKVAAQYPEIRELNSYIFAAGALEAVRSKYTTAAPLRETTQAPGFAALDGLQPLIDRLSANGQVVVIHPEPLPGEGGSLRYVTVIAPIHRSLERTVDLATQFPRMGEALPEVKKVTVTPRGADFDVALKTQLGVSLLSFPLDMTLLNHRASPTRLEFQRSGGQVARIYGAMEWRSLSANNTLMLSSSAQVLGDDGPWLLRNFYKIVGLVPYAGSITLMSAQQIALMRLRTWAEAQPADAAGH